MIVWNLVEGIIIRKRVRKYQEFEIVKKDKEDSGKPFRGCCKQIRIIKQLCDFFIDKAEIQHPEQKIDKCNSSNREGGRENFFGLCFSKEVNGDRNNKNKCQPVFL